MPERAEHRGGSGEAPWTFEARLAGVGSRLDAILGRARGEGRRVDEVVEDVAAKVREGIETARAKVDDARVQLNLAKLESKERADPLVADARSRAGEVRADVGELRDGVEESIDTLRIGVHDALGEFEAALDAAIDSIRDVIRS